MCGICGFIKLGRNRSKDDGSTIKKMNGKLLHRGPDAQDFIILDNVVFGFSRLSIIGLENGMQPIFNEDESIFVICNGEIFNYIELKQELITKGHIFKTMSDVEVLVHLYEEYGHDFLDKLNGQFAFALYDRKKKKLFCARDQMGIIPFFYTISKGVFIFGSEIKAILEHPAVEKGVDMTGLDQVFTFAGLSSPRTMFKGIKSLENGHALIVDENLNISDFEYWDLIYPKLQEECEEDEKYFIDKLEHFLNESIRLRLRADVPLGLYLSGGLDSSIISMKVNELEKNVVKEAFSIDFIDSQLSESVYQNLVAKESGANLNQKVFFNEDISKRLQKSIYHSECPIKETYNTASLSLSESVRQKGIKVILSGEGADELFAGYVGYRFDHMREIGVVENQCSAKESALRNRMWGDETFFYERNYDEFNAVKKKLYADAQNDVFDDFNCLNHFKLNLERLKDRSRIHQRAYIDFKMRLVDHLVSDHGDRMALANSVEVRYPFLDKNFVNFSTKVPSKLKLKDFNEKYILKKMACKFLPKAIIDREKFGFVAPGSAYLLQNNVEYVKDLLSYDLIKKQGFFNPNEIERLKKQYSQDGFSINAPFEDDILITVITFGIFLETFF